MKWTNEQRNLLQLNYATMPLSGLAFLLGIPEASVRSMAHYMGLYPAFKTNEQIATTPVRRRPGYDNIDLPQLFADHQVDVNDPKYKLKPREMYIIRCRLGLVDGRIHSFVELAEELDISVQRVQELQEKARRYFIHYQIYHR